MRIRPRPLVVWMLCALHPSFGAEADRVPDVTYVEQPTGIELEEYVRTWPGLRTYVARLREGAATEVLTELRRADTAAIPPDGVWNLLAQLERQRGSLDPAEDWVGRAIALDPKQHLHHFQQAMVFFARLERASGRLERWKWHRRTREAYERAFALNPRPVPYRYYLTYTFLQTPAWVGGDKDEALRMAQEAIDMGQKEFTIVRADARRFRGEVAEAFEDYDRCIALKVFKLNSFLAAGQLALERGERERARRYFDWAVRCRPDSPRTHEGKGDYLVAAGDPKAAAAAYEEALRRDPGRASAREKLARLKQAS